MRNLNEIRGFLLNVKKILDRELDELISLAVTELPDDVEQALKLALEKEDSELGKMNLKLILENLSIARNKRLPICQDTGVLNFYIKVGEDCINHKELLDIIKNAVRRATLNIPLRPSIVDPLTRKNSGNNVGERIPYLYIETIDEPYFEITVFPKGAGSENMCRLFMLTPRDGIAGIKKSVLDAIVEAGGRACPPIIIGLGIGGTSDLAMKLSKEALLRPIGKPNPNDKIANLENELLKIVNSIGLGTMGLGGKITSLGVNIEYADCHTASLPLGVSFQCWADRRAVMRIYEDEKVEYLSHRRVRN